MFGLTRDHGGLAAKLDALVRSQAAIEFRFDGTILAANANFLTALGYTLAEVRGQHHAMFDLMAAPAVAELMASADGLIALACPGPGSDAAGNLSLSI